MISVAICEGLQADGPEQYWCWLTEEHMLARFLVFDVPMFLILILDVAVYFKIYREISEMKKESQNVNDDNATSLKNTKFVFRISLFLVVYFVCWLWILLDDFFDIFAPTQSQVIEAICAVISPLQGFLNAFIYGWTFHRKLLQWIRTKSSSNSVNISTCTVSKA